MKLGWDDEENTYDIIDYRNGGDTNNIDGRNVVGGGGEKATGSTTTIVNDYS